jgi:hypothetical protein
MANWIFGRATGCFSPPRDWWLVDRRHLLAEGLHGFIDRFDLDHGMERLADQGRRPAGARERENRPADLARQADLGEGAGRTADADDRLAGGRDEGVPGVAQAARYDQVEIGITRSDVVARKDPDDRPRLTASMTPPRPPDTIP